MMSVYTLKYKENSWMSIQVNKEQIEKLKIQ